jgi:hypothetical protein
MNAAPGRASMHESVACNQTVTVFAAETGVGVAVGAGAVVGVGVGRRVDFGLAVVGVDPEAMAGVVFLTVVCVSVAVGVGVVLSVGVGVVPSAGIGVASSTVVIVATVGILPPVDPSAPHAVIRTIIPIIASVDTTVLTQRQLFCLHKSKVFSFIASFLLIRG